MQEKNIETLGVCVPLVGWREHVAIAAVSMAVLLFEVLITRVLSVTLAYHFAFLVVSVAMLGLGAPGVWFSLIKPGPRALRYVLLASSVSLPVSILLIVNLGGSLRELKAFWVFCLLLPMVALGSAVCILLLRAKGSRVGKMYAADLAGAALGAVLVVPLMHGLPTPVVLAALAVLPLAATVLLDRGLSWITVSVAVALVASLAWGTPYRLHYTKYYVEESPPIYERWTPTARVTVFGVAPGRGFVGWGVGSHGPSLALEHLWLDQDGSAGTQILRYGRGEQFPQELLFDVTAAPFQIGTPSRACIIGGGGGRDILTALAADVQAVDVVELNPYIVDAVSRIFGKYSGDPYHLPGVRVFLGEGRSHFSRADQLCDVLQISLIDTFTATAAGAYALTENSLYTVEALRSFWSRLTPDGVLSISRWSNGPGWTESVRLVLLAVEALRQEGIADPHRHLVVLAAGAVANTMVFRRPVDAARLAELSSLEQSRGFNRLWPMAASKQAMSFVTIALRKGPEPFARLGLDLSPTTDDRPFFFQTLDIFSGLDSLVEFGSGEREQSVSLLRKLLLTVSVVAIALFFLPLVLRGRLPSGSSLRRGTTYFVSIGCGFMFVEMPLVQRLALYLGHPSYATTVVLGALLLGAGVGASLALRIPDGRRRGAILIVPLAIAILILPLLGPLAAATLQWGLMARVTLTTVVVLASGISMGLPFPLGMACFDGRDRSWYWAVNGVAGVLASILALVCSLVFGFSLVMVFALACYLLAALSLPRSEAGDYEVRESA